MEISLIKIILIFGLCGSFLLYFTHFRSQTFDRIIATALFLLAGLFVFAPKLTAVIANTVGVGRGTDLVFYVFALGNVFCLILLYARLSRLREATTEIARHIAITEARKGNSINTTGSPIP